LFLKNLYENNTIQIIIFFFLIILCCIKLNDSYSHLKKFKDKMFFEDFYLQYDASKNYKIYFSAAAPDFRPYPPTTSLFYKIFTYLSYRKAALIFQTINLLLTSFIIITCFYLFTMRKIADLNFIIILGLLFFPLNESIYLGQLNLLILSSILLTLLIELYFNSQYKYCLIGLIIAFGASLKIFPLVILAYYLLKKQFAPIIYFLFFSILIVLATLLIFGYEVFDFYFKNIMPHTANSWVILSIENQSLLGLYSRIFGNTFQRGFTGIIYYPKLIKPLYFLSVLILIIWTWKIINKSHDTIYKFMILIALGLLVFGLNWAHTFVLAFPIIIYIFYELIKNKNYLYLIIWAAAFLLLSHYFDFRNTAIYGLQHLLTLPNYTGAVILMIIFNFIKIRNNLK